MQAHCGICGIIIDQTTLWLAVQSCHSIPNIQDRCRNRRPRPAVRMRWRVAISCFVRVPPILPGSRHPDRHRLAIRRIRPEQWCRTHHISHCVTQLLLRKRIQKTFMNIKAPKTQNTHLCRTSLTINEKSLQIFAIPAPAMVAGAIPPHYIPTEPLRARRFQCHQIGARVP
jgi:hypothetical protein